MKRNLIIVLSVIFFFAIVSAITVGQIFSQSQLDNINVQNQDLDDHFFRNDLNKVEHKCGIVGTSTICEFYVGIKTLVQNTDVNGTKLDNYTVIEKTVTIKTRAKTWIDLKNEHNKSYAVSELKKWLVNERTKIEHNTKLQIEKMQTVETSDMADIVSDLDI